MVGSKQKPARGGGALLALAILVGAVAGLYSRQPMIGLVAGLGAGLALLLLMWLLDRRRG
jgi:hypothetical protein